MRTFQFFTDKWGLAKLFEIKEVQAEIEEIKSIFDEVQGEGKEDEKGDKVFLRTLKDKNDNYIFPPNSIGEISAWGYKILESSVIPNSNSCCAKGSSCDKTAESILRVADSFVVKVLDPLFFRRASDPPLPARKRQASKRPLSRRAKKDRWGRLLMLILPQFF